MPKANVDHTISCKGNGTSTLDHMTTTPRALNSPGNNTQVCMSGSIEINSQYLEQNTHQGAVAKQVVMYTSCCKFSWEILLFCQIVLLFDRNVVLTSQQYNMMSQQQYHGNIQQEVYMTTCFTTAPLVGIVQTCTQ